MLKNEIFIAIPQREYFGGDIITGYAEVRLPFPQKTQGVYLHFQGFENCDLSQKNKIARETNAFVSLSMLLPGPGSMDHGNKLFGGKVKKAMDVAPGAHRYPFSFRLPPLLPCSFRSMAGKIEYEIKIVFEAGDKGGTDLVQTYSLPIGGSLYDMNYLGNNAKPINIQEAKSFGLLTKGPFDINVSLDSKCFLAGDIINVRLDLNNKSSKTVEQAKVSIVQRVEYLIYNDVRKEEEHELSIAPIGDVTSKADSHPQLQLTLPVTCPETVFSSQQGKAKIGKIVRISYKVVFSGNPKVYVEVPITVVRRSAATQAAIGVLPGMQQQPMQQSFPQQQQYQPMQGQPQQYQPMQGQPQPQQNPGYVPMHTSAVQAPQAPANMQPGSQNLYPTAYPEGTIDMAYINQMNKSAPVMVGYDESSNASSEQNPFQQVDYSQQNPFANQQQQPQQGNNNGAPVYDQFYQQ